MVVDEHAVPDLQRREVAHERLGAADVVGIAVRDGEVVQPADAAGAQRRADDAIADVEVAANRHAAGVDQQRPPIRQRHQHRIALPHIEHRQVQPAVAESTRERLRRNRDPEEHCRGRTGDRTPRPRAERRPAIAATSSRVIRDHQPPAPATALATSATAPSTTIALSIKPAHAEMRDQPGNAGERWSARAVGRRRDHRGHLDDRHARNRGEVHDQSGNRDALKHERGNRASGRSRRTPTPAATRPAA